MATVLRRRRKPATSTTTAAAITKPHGQHNPFVKTMHDGPKTFHVVLCHECADDEGLDRRVAVAIHQSSSRIDANRMAGRHRG